MHHTLVWDDKKNQRLVIKAEAKFMDLLKDGMMYVNEGWKGRRRCKPRVLEYKEIGHCIGKENTVKFANNRYVFLVYN